MTDKIVVTRHPALVQYLIEEGYVSSDVEVLSHVETVDHIHNCHVYGVLPLGLACCAKAVTEVRLDIPAEMRGKELTIQQVREYAMYTQTYTVDIVE